MLGGALGYWSLPISALPQVDFPTIQVKTQLPGANPDTIAALVTAPLERQFGQIPALATMTSSSSFGISQVTLQFDLSRDIDAAAQDVQSAIKPPAHAATQLALPAASRRTAVRRSCGRLPPRPSTSVRSALADTIMAPRLSEVTGVGHVSVQAASVRRSAFSRFVAAGRHRA
jgi:multidrug efflux pump